MNAPTVRRASLNAAVLSLPSRGRRLYLRTALAFSLMLAAPTLTQAEKPFALGADSRVVFYGDSITEQCFYTRWLELFVDTRYPGMRVRFWMAGVGGDRVTGGGGGTIDTRLARDVFPFHPDHITIMLGMNDGGYAPLTAKSLESYQGGFAHILDSVASHLPGAQVLLIGPSPFDEVTRTDPLVPGGYNQVLLRFSDADRELAAQRGATFTDANRPFVDALERAKAQDKAASQLLVPDRVHPDLAAHIMIAAAVLRGWNAPALVSATELDAIAAASTGGRGVKVTEIRSSPTGLSWTSVEDALPLPLPPNNAALTYAAAISGFQDEFNQEQLRVRGLLAGRYTLTIDAQRTGTFSAADLAAGVNLAKFDTPMLRHAERVEWTIRDKQGLQFVRLRARIASPNSSVTGLDAVEEDLQQNIWQSVVPVAHHFALSREAK